MSTKLKDLAEKEEILRGGHRLCAGCGASVAVRQILMGLPQGDKVVTASPTGCLEVSTTIYPYTSWNCSFIHNGFENVASTLSGTEAAYRSLKKQGKIDENYHFVVFAGDGGTYDIGFQALSGALERNHDMVYVCYNNEAYMNTGIQRSGATLKGASTTTTPPGEESIGKEEHRKDLTEIVAAHDIPYVAQASISHWRDAIKKAQKAFEVDGPAFINILAPCHRGWRFPMEQTVELAKKAVKTAAWPLYEIENGKYNVTSKIKDKEPIEEYLKMQGRFGHLFKKEESKEVIESIQAYVDEKWESLQAAAERDK